MNGNPVRAAKVVRVIETTGVSGDGTTRDPVRTTKAYWTLDGELLFQIDPYLVATDRASSNASSEST